MSFYMFRQNNSHGSFVHDATRGIGLAVIVEAPSVAKANALAQSIGIYFNGCDSGQDCSCCGDRWSELWEDEEGSDEPMYYDRPIAEAAKDGFGVAWWGLPVYVHYADGRVQRFDHAKSKKKARA